MRIEAIDDVADPRLDDYRNLRDADLRARRGLFVAESRAIVRRLIAARRFRVHSALVTPAGLAALRDDLERSDIPAVYVAGLALVRAVAGFDFHRGCAAVAERPCPQTSETLVDVPGPRRLLLLEDLADPDNVGSVFRNAMAFGVNGALLSPACADPLSRKAIRVSAGGSLTIPFARVSDAAAAAASLVSAGYTVVALTPRDGLDLGDLGAALPLPSRVAVALGAESSGLRPETVGQATLQVQIRMAPGVDSLNVAAACAIALHHLTAQQTGPLSASGFDPDLARRGEPGEDSPLT